MGLDGTIKRADGTPLGNVETVQNSLAAAFPGIVFGRRPGGEEKIRAAAEKGVVFPDIIRESLERSPAELGGEFEGSDFSASFVLGPSETVQRVHVLLYGNTTSSEPMLAILRQRF